jgi:hypothetical protein
VFVTGFESGDVESGFARFFLVGVVQPSSRSEWADWFGDLFGTLCIRVLEIIKGDTTVLDLYDTIVHAGN